MNAEAFSPPGPAPRRTGPPGCATFSGNLDGSGRTAVVFLGGMADPDAVGRPDIALTATAEEEFRSVTGREARELHVHRTAMPAWDVTWRALDGLAVPQGIHLLAAYSGRPGIVGRLREAEALARRIAGEPPRWTR